MRYIILLFVAAGLQAQVTDIAGVATKYPWEFVTYGYRAIDIVTDSAGHIISSNPAAHVWVSMIIEDGEPGNPREDTGWHSHGSPDSQRPSYKILPVTALNAAIGETPQRHQTDANGWAYFQFQGNNFSGHVSTTLIGEGGYGADRHHAYFVYTDKIKNGGTYADKLLKSLDDYGDTKPYSYHNDGRHLSFGNPTVSRYANDNARASMGILARWYKMKTGRELDVIRGSIPDGGCADNPMFNGLTTVYRYAVWDQKACNPIGVEWDVENPAIDAGGMNSQSGQDAFTLFEQSAYNIARCQYAKVKDDGTKIDPTDANPQAIYEYWTLQPVLRIVCSEGPAASFTMLDSLRPGPFVQ